MSILNNPKNISLSKNYPYDIYISKEDLSIYIKLSMYTKYLHTNYFPSTLNILSDSLPSVLKTKCFNKNNYSFQKEVLRTELGHLFEHILLQYLCELKLESGAKIAVYNGLTQWDWERDLRGTFHITLSINDGDEVILAKALANTESLIKKILSSSLTQSNIN